MKHNQTTKYGNMHYSYDGFGRMLTREGHQGFEKQRFHYDSESRITKIELLNHSYLKAVEFEYDPLGRRTQKRAIPKESFHQTETTHFGWISMQMVHEHNDKTKNSCLYIYNDGSYEPLARIEKHDDENATAGKISYYSNYINGCPDAMLDDEGNIIWIAKITTFGKAEKELKVDRINVQQNLRYRGQYLDRETGLHYNTFRYYDPEIGRFTQQDPIDLAGGFNLYQYASNMIHWIDPWGWDSLYENPGHHDPGYLSDKQVPFNNTKSILPENHQEIWKNSVPDPSDPKTRWAKVGDGKNAVYHRIQSSAPSASANATSVSTCFWILFSSDQINLISGVLKLSPKVKKSIICAVMKPSKHT